MPFLYTIYLYSTPDLHQQFQLFFKDNLINCVYLNSFYDKWLQLPLFYNNDLLPCYRLWFQTVQGAETFFFFQSKDFSVYFNQQKSLERKRVEWYLMVKSLMYEEMHYFLVVKFIYCITFSLTLPANLKLFTNNIFNVIYYLRNINF